MRPASYGRRTDAPLMNGIAGLSGKLKPGNLKHAKDGSISLRLQRGQTNTSGTMIGGLFAILCFAAAQAAYRNWRRNEGHKEETPHFVELQIRMNLRKPVRPGEVVKFRAELTEALQGTLRFAVKGHVGDVLVADAEVAVLPCRHGGWKFSCLLEPLWKSDFKLHWNFARAKATDKATARVVSLRHGALSPTESALMAMIALDVFAAQAAYSTIDDDGLEVGKCLTVRYELNLPARMDRRGKRLIGRTQTSVGETSLKMSTQVERVRKTHGGACKETSVASATVVMVNVTRDEAGNFRKSPIRKKEAIDA